MDWLFHELKDLFGPVGALITVVFLFPLGWVIKGMIDRLINAPHPMPPEPKLVTTTKQVSTLSPSPKLVVQSFPPPLREITPPSTPPTLPSTPFPPPLRETTLDLNLRPITVPESLALENSLGMRFCNVPSGSFSMGSPPTEVARKSDEEVHRVVISNPFWIGIYPVTQQQFMAIMGRNSSAAKHDGTNRPVESVTWEEAIEFCRRLSERPAERLAGRIYRLPTEAEWEYACRAGTQTAYAFGEELSPHQANFGGTPYNTRQSPGVYRGRITNVGEYPSNDWGVFDMHGNVWEWCRDFYALDYGVAPNTQEIVDPQGPSGGAERVIKGGCWSSAAATDCRSARRRKRVQKLPSDTIGFRVVCDSTAEYVTTVEELGLI